MFTALIKSSNFRRLFTALLLSSTGLWFYYVGVSVLVYHLTGSALSVGIIFMTRQAPVIFFSFVGGVIADHYNKRLVMPMCKLLSALTILFIFFVNTTQDVWLIYVIGFVSACLGSTFQPCRMAAIHDVIDPALQKTANVYFNAAENLTMIFSASLAGVLYAAYGIQILLVLNFILNIFSALLIFSIRDLGITKQISSVTSSFKQRVLAGWRCIRTTPKLNKMFHYNVYSQIGFCAYFIIITIYPIKLFSLDSQGVGFFYSIYGLGTVIALLFSTYVSHKAVLLYETLRPYLVFVHGLFFVFLSLTSSAAFGMILFLAATTTYMIYYLSQENIKLLLTDKIYMGRVSAFQNSITIIVLIIFSTVYGKIGDLLSVRAIGLSAGLFLVFFPLLYELLYSLGPKTFSMESETSS